MKIKECIEVVTKEIPVVEVEANGIKVQVKKWLPYSVMEEMAMELASMALMFDADVGFACIGHGEKMAKAYLIVKYFTDLDIEGCTPEEVFDYVTATELLEKIESAVDNAMWRVEDIYYLMCRTLVDKFMKENSVEGLLKKTFGFLLTGEDITESLAKSEGIANRMVEVMDIFQRHEKEQAVLKSTKKDSSKMKIGGATLSLAKK